MGLVIGAYYWQPDPGSKFAAPYTADDVRRLQRMVAKHCTIPHEFAVITDRPELFADDPDIRAIPIDKTTHVPGTCYVRLMTFHPEGRALFGAERLLQIDLDTLIVGNIDHLVTREEDVVLWRNPARVPWEPIVDGTARSMAEWDGTRFVHRINQNRCYYNTSILYHRLGAAPWLWQYATEWNGSPPFKDDQWYLSDFFGDAAYYFDGERDGVYRIARADTPGSGVHQTLPSNAAIVTFPGSEGKWSDPKIRRENIWIEMHLNESATTD